ncbi:unnamed protein product [Ilex paraguariensis]|uniref:Uncharacterized protein n=1 Tax=Ilex paraguariensis TaxID=185542 RepID=A0ABC8V498_9AQUA
MYYCGGKGDCLQFALIKLTLSRLLFFWKKQYFTIKDMLKMRMFAWDSADSCVVDGLIAGARDYLVVSPEELIESVGSCLHGDPAEDIEIIDVSD